MKTALVGFTGFVGSNLCDSFCFDNLYNSQNIETAYGSEPDLLVYAGVRAEKFIANQNSDEDLKSINHAYRNIVKINPGKLVLISTVDVYNRPASVDEDSVISPSSLQPYGAHRYLLEQDVRRCYGDALIVRLPGLYGKNIKKNFIYDFMHPIPRTLNKEKFSGLSAVCPLLKDYYSLQSNGFYMCNSLDEEARSNLHHIFQTIPFSSIHFTDSRSQFQFYNLTHLWTHVQSALKHNITLLNLATEPINAKELYRYLTGNLFYNQITSAPPLYDMRTKYDYLFNGGNGYIFNKDMVMDDIKEFVKGEFI